MSHGQNSLYSLVALVQGPYIAPLDTDIDIEIDVEVDIDRYFWLFKGGLEVSSGTV